MARSKPNMPPDLVDLHPDPWTEPFWLAARDHRLVAPRCRFCGTFRMPPTGFCRKCRQQDVEWVDLASVERCIEVYLATAEKLCN